MFQTKLAIKNSYIANIKGIRLRLAKLQKLNSKAWKIQTEGRVRYKEIDKVLYYQELFFLPKIIWTKLISKHHNNPLVGQFDINKTRKSTGRKHYWPSYRKYVKVYVKDCDIYLALKTVKYKPYSNLQTC